MNERSTTCRSIRSAPIRKPFSNLRITALDPRKVVRCGFLFALAFFGLAASSSAQPAISRGVQLLTINYDECMQRAEQAYVAEGWVKIGKGNMFVNAFKGIHGAYIMCNACGIL